MAYGAFISHIPTRLRGDERTSSTEVWMLINTVMRSAWNENFMMNGRFLSCQLEWLRVG